MYIELFCVDHSSYLKRVAMFLFTCFSLNVSTNLQEMLVLTIRALKLYEVYDEAI